MKAKVQSVHNHGDANAEFVLIAVNEDCDIGNFILADTSYLSSGTVSNKLRHMYWIPDRKVKKGDFVSIHTREGQSFDKTLDTGAKLYHFYWGLKSAVWNDTGDCAALFEIAHWQFYPVRGK